MCFIIHFFIAGAVEVNTRKIIMCQKLMDDFRFTDLSLAFTLQRFSQYQNSLCEEAVMNLAVFFFNARQLHSN